MDWVETFALRRATEDLGDDEYFWCPAPECWTVRLGASGVPVLDYDVKIAAQPPSALDHPLTTIAWNLAHICDAPGALATFDFLGGPRPAGDYETRPPPFSAAEACDRLWTGWANLRAALAEVADAPLETGWRWSFGETTGWHHIALILNEISHHGAQVCELRDLFRSLQGAR